MTGQGVKMPMMRLRDVRGYTLTELIIVMAIFVTIIMISAAAFENIVYRSSQHSKSVETQIEGIVGLEVLRADLEHAGYGLPWTFRSLDPAVSYLEVDANETVPAPFWPSGWSPVSFNDAPGTPPRAILSADTTFNRDTAGIGSKYLVIKSILAASNDAAKKSALLSYDQNGVKTLQQWGVAGMDFTANDRVIVVRNSLNSTPPTRELMATASTVFSSRFATYSTLTSLHDNGDTFVIYGVTNDTDLRMPFNRADYYVMRPATRMPKECADSQGVGILYKSTVIHGTGSSAGGLTLGMPLLDCVADMQVVYGLDTDGGGRVNQYLESPAATASPTAADIRRQLREIRVYILAQEGKKDRLFSYPSETVLVGETLNGVVRGRVFNLRDQIGADYRNYRWKVYTIVVRPKNLFQ